MSVFASIELLFGPSDQFESSEEEEEEEEEEVIDRAALKDKSRQIVCHQKNIEEDEAQLGKYNAAGGCNCVQLRINWCQIPFCKNWTILTWKKIYNGLRKIGVSEFKSHYAS